MINKNSLVPMLIGICIGVIFTAVILTLNRRILPAPILIEPPPLPPTAVSSATPGPIRIFVNGEVDNPGVYTLSPDSILQELIEEAGGFNGEANVDVVNLAQPLQDGMQVYVPSLAETVVAPIISEPEVVDASSQGAAGLIDINEATVTELDTLPGIGPATAQKIVEFRDANGLFLNEEEILLVSGIGEAKYEQIEDLITVGE